MQLHIEGEEDFEPAQELATTVPRAKLLVYSGGDHDVAERDMQAAALMTQRVLHFSASPAIPLSLSARGREAA